MKTETTTETTPPTPPTPREESLAIAAGLGAVMSAYLGDLSPAVQALAQPAQRRAYSTYRPSYRSKGWQDAPGAAITCGPCLERIGRGS